MASLMSEGLDDGGRATGALAPRAGCCAPVAGCSSSSCCSQSSLGGGGSTPANHGWAWQTPVTADNPRTTPPSWRWCCFSGSPPLSPCAAPPLPAVSLTGPANYRWLASTARLIASCTLSQTCLAAFPLDCNPLHKPFPDLLRPTSPIIIPGPVLLPPRLIVS